MFTLTGLGEKHGGQPGRIRCYSSDQNQKMQKFPVAGSEMHLNFIEQSPICIVSPLE
jgi:hypothetical protein